MRLYGSFLAIAVLWACNCRELGVQDLGEDPVLSWLMHGDSDVKVVWSCEHNSKSMIYVLGGRPYPRLSQLNELLLCRNQNIPLTQTNMDLNKTLFHERLLSEGPLLSC